MHIFTAMSAMKLCHHFYICMIHSLMHTLSRSSIIRTRAEVMAAVSMLILYFLLK